MRGRFGSAVILGLLVAGVLPASPGASDPQADGYVIRVEPWTPTLGLPAKPIVNPVTLADGLDYYLFQVRMQVLQADSGSWRDEALDPATVYLQIRPPTTPPSEVPVYGGADDAFLFAGDATRAVVAVPLAARIEGPVVVEAQVAGRSGAFNFMKPSAAPPVADVLDAIPTPILLGSDSDGTLAWSAVLEILPLGSPPSSYQVRVEATSPFVESTTLRTPHGTAPVLLDATAPSLTPFAAAPNGVVATTDGTRFTLPGHTTFGDPVARFLSCRTAVPCTTSVTRVISLENVTVDGRYSTSPFGQALAYRWSFGDGRVSYGDVLRHDWKASGIYTLALTVTDEVGRSSTTSLPLTVLNQAPTGSLALPATTDRVAGLTIVPALADVDGYVVRLEWSLDGGAPAWPQGAAIAYADPKLLSVGSHTVEVLFWDNNGAVGAAAGTFTIVNLPPTSVGRSLRSLVAAGASFELLDLSYDPDPFPLAARSWNFADGRVLGTTATSVTHAYAADGVYRPTLTVTDSDGAVASHLLDPITVDGYSPTVSVALPPSANGWYRAESVSGQSTAQDNRDRAPKVTVEVDGARSQLSDGKFVAQGDGIHVVRSTAVDHVGWTTVDTKLVRIDSTAPIVQFDFPIPWASGVTRLAASGSDATSGVARITLHVDGVLLAESIGPGPLTADWDTRGELAGLHAVRATVWDAAGNSASREFAVLVQNAA